ncbi:9100_t:CDS:1 [Racocetra fulgida]|uniref:9100_t:CDS:1 n=1 Tax=Racocetra fulgida TaxID=60492 RepID=A0A9N9I1T9_9GLOM|nr:9100_t:CDS:1 [Racocetra fulgida]
MNSAFTNLDGEINLSEEMKSFSVLAQEKRQVFIKHTLMQNTSIDTWRAIPVTEQEVEIMKNESTMRKEELISVINSILISLPETQRSKYTNLKNKTKTILLTILQEIRGLNNAEDAIDEENEDKELIDEEMI